MGEYKDTTEQKHLDINQHHILQQFLAKNKKYLMDLLVSILIKRLNYYLAKIQ